ncbi:MAG: DUF1028 domain-containing protein [Vicinamibacterales bacterium]
MMRALFAVLFTLVAAPAFATWSVLAIDQRTGQVVIASATCVRQAAFAGFPAKGLMDVQAIVVPGKAVAAAQAAVDNTRNNQMLVYTELQRGTAPEAIIAMLATDPRYESRQFGILDLQGRFAGHSGSRNGAVSLHRQGQVPGERIFYSIQGNILKSEEVVTAAVAAFLGARGELTDRVMAAMTAADEKGGDRRCTCDSAPKIDAPCTAKTSHVAYILRADKNDATGESYNDGKYALYLSATDADITPAEDANPVKTLRMRYDAWKQKR